MKALSFFFIIILLGTLNISCSSSKKEIDSLQNDAGEKQVLQAAQKETTEKDTIFSQALFNIAPTRNDTVTGILYVAGNEPFTKLAFYISSDTVFYVKADSSLKSQLWQLQGKRVKIVGMIKSSPMGTEINVSSFSTAP